MKRYIARTFLLTFIILSFASAATIAAPRFARVVIGTREAILTPRPLVENDIVYAPIAMLKSLDISHVVGQHKAVIALEEGTAELALFEKQGVRMIRLDEAAKAIDAEYIWDEETSTAKICAKIAGIEFENSIITARLTLPASAGSTRLWSEPWRISVDIVGAKVAASKTIAIGNTDVPQVRLGQFKDDTARIVIDLNRKLNYRILTKGNSREIKIAIGKPQTISASPGNKQNAQVIAASDIEPAVPVDITGIKVEPDGDSRIIVKIATKGLAKVKATSIPFPLRLAIDVENATLAMSSDEIAVDNPLLKGIRVGKQNKAIRVVLDTGRFLAWNVQSEEGCISATLALPTGAGGKLSDKIIVIDAGHGGNDPGARGGDVKEKNINLALALKTKEALERIGATVVLTRDSDCFLDLASRPAVADKCCAHFFISIHCNALFPEKKTGVETYYHPSQPSSRALAFSVHSSIIKKTGMKDLSTRLDTKLYKSGLAVLRNANVPAILVESGYIDCTRDRNLLCSDDYRTKFAEAILEGLRDYVEGRIELEDNQDD